jgi:glycosyltransferase involved in cell wall biosynthesis
MRIVLVNWAKFADGARAGGGVNGYARDLALALVARGHEVAWLSAGLTYVADAASELSGACEVRRLPDDEGVQVYDIVNSPVVAPGIFQFRDPMGEISAPALEAELTRFLRVWRPEIVHFHNIEGFSCGCIDAAKVSEPGWPGAAVYFSLHNYHTLCPQVYLMHKGTTPCIDFDNGHACEGCMAGHDPLVEKRLRAGLDPAGPPPRPEPSGLGAILPSPLGRMARLARRAVKASIPLPIIEPPMPGRSVRGHEDAAPATLAAPAPSAPVPWSEEHLTQPTWRPLDNRCDPPPASTRVMSPHGTRRQAMVDMLARCDRVLAVSSFVRRKFESMGVPAAVLREMPIGSRMVERAARHPWLLPSLRDVRPVVRLGFMGYNNTYKGLPMLLDALDLLVPETLARLDLSIWAKDIEPDLPRVESFRRRLAGLHVQGGYSHDDVPGMLAGIDAGLVPSIWWDNGPQTVMEFLACGVPVIGAALGGIVDLVRHDVNGLLFRGNDRFDLARTLARVATDPTLLGRLREGIRPPLTMAAHAAAMEAEYRATIAARTS